MDFNSDFLRTLEQQNNFFDHDNLSYTRIGISVGEVNGQLEVLLIFSV